jgi:hypothetical protein
MDPGVCRDDGVFMLSVPLAAGTSAIPNKLFLALKFRKTLPSIAALYGTLGKKFQK